MDKRYDRSTVSHSITRVQPSVFFFKPLMPPSSGDFERLELLDFEDSSENSSFSFFEVLRKTWVPVKMLTRREVGDNKHIIFSATGHLIITEKMTFCHQFELYYFLIHYLKSLNGTMSSWLIICCIIPLNEINAYHHYQYRHHSFIFSG